MIHHIPVLENAKVKLQPLSKEDAVSLAGIALAEPELFSLMSQQLKTNSDVYAFIRKALDEFNEGVALPFLVIDKATGKVVGTTRFGNLVREHKRVEIGWTWLSEAYHGTGVNKAMKFLMLQYAFETLQFNRVEIKTNELNLRSRRAIESLGAKFEGILRHHIVNENGSLRNTVYYSILKEEWQDVKANIFERHLKMW